MPAIEIGQLLKVTVLVLACWSGAFVLYSRLRTEGREVIEFVEWIAPNWQSPYRQLVETVLFSSIGALVSYVIGEPLTLRQAFSIGLGWTSLIGTIERRQKRGR